MPISQWSALMDSSQPRAAMPEQSNQPVGTSSIQIATADWFALINSLFVQRNALLAELKSAKERCAGLERALAQVAAKSAPPGNTK